MRLPSVDYRVLSVDSRSGHYHIRLLSVDYQGFCSYLAHILSVWDDLNCDWLLASEGICVTMAGNQEARSLNLQTFGAQIHPVNTMLLISCSYLIGLRLSKLWPTPRIRGYLCDHGWRPWGSISKPLNFRCSDRVVKIILLISRSYEHRKFEGFVIKPQGHWPWSHR